MKRLRATIFSAAILILSVTAQAQNADTSKSGGWFHHDMHGIAGTFQIQSTYRYTSLGDLNRIISPAGLGTLSGNNVWINASMNHVHNNWILEDGIGFTPVSTSTGNNIKAKFNQYQAFAKLGYNVINNADMRAFPFAGVNVSAAVLHIQDRNAIRSTSDFSDELLTTSATKTFYQPNFGIELGGGFDYLIPLSEKTMDCFTVKRSIPIGIRAGYYINAARGDWRIEDNYKVHNGPDKNQSAFFVSLNIGLGYAVKK
jgi:hypothetical protein